MGSDNSDEENRDRVLAPDDLDITKQPEVEEIDDGRYVVSPDGPAKKPDRDLLENPDWLTDEDGEETAPQSSDDHPSQHDQSTPATQSGGASQQSPGPNQPDRQTQQSTPTEQSGERTPNSKQSGGPNRQSTPTGQSSGPNQQSTPTGQSDGRNQQSPPSNQSTNRGQQAGTTQSGGQSRQPSANTQSGGPSQQSPTTQSEPPSQQSTSTNHSESRSQQSTPNKQPSGGGNAPPSSEIAAHDQPPVEPPAVELTNENVSKFLAEELTQGGGDYGFDATLNVEGTVNRGRMTSDDIGETLETLLRWYARQTTDEVEPESVLGIILAGSDLAVEYPVQSVYTVVKRHDLTPDDSISDLLAAVRKEGSFTVPPSEE